MPARGFPDPGQALRTDWWLTPRVTRPKPARFRWVGKIMTHTGVATLIAGAFDHHNINPLRFRGVVIHVGSRKKIRWCILIKKESSARLRAELWTA